MRLQLSSSFKRQLKKLPRSVLPRVIESLDLLLSDAYHPRLRNHALHGVFSGNRSINVTGDIRIVYEKISDDIFYLKAVGSHSALYE